MADGIVCVPMKLDAFLLNPSTCNAWPRATLAPITQPNYTFLRLDANYIQPDVLPHIDLHGAANVDSNDRITDLGRGDLRNHRIGVYLHWILPRVYRTGTAATGYDSFGAPKDPSGELARRAAAGYPSAAPSSTSNVDQQSIVFRNTPNRWLVIRRLQMLTVKPPVAQKRLKPFHAFLVESDRLQNIQTLDNSVDLQVDVTPFINGYDANLNNPDGLAGQAEIFIGNTFQDALNVPSLGGVPWKEQDVTRVPVSVLNSSNHLFPDYVPHNGSVFSMLDDFTYLPDDKPGTKPTKLQSATASYQVIGWHSDKNIADDPFFIDPNLTNPPTRNSRLGTNKMVLSTKVSSPQNVTDWLSQTTSARTLCHGSMYSVEYSLTDPPKIIAADALGNLLSKAAPVAVGTTPLDSVLSFVGAHIKLGDTDDNENILFKDLKALQTLLLKQEETTDNQYEANDILSAHNYAPAKNSGFSWHLSGQNPEGKPTQPTPAQLSLLTELNVLQEALDLATRDLRLERWNLWSLWWKYYSQRPTESAANPPAHPENEAQSKLVVDLGNKVTDLQQQVNNKAAALKVCEKGARNRFYSLRDPTLLVSGISSPWPTDFTDNLLVRLGSQIVAPLSVPVGAPNDWSQFGTFVDQVHSAAILPNTALQDAAKRLMIEFFELHPLDPLETFTSSVKGSDVGVVTPLYHDQGGDIKLGPRDTWGSIQPWFPLFLEWEVHYYHIPFEKWNFEQVDAPDSGATRTRYGIQPEVDLDDPKEPHPIKENVRTLSGRVLILPQPSFSLKNTIDQLVLSTSKGVLLSALKINAGDDPATVQAELDAISDTISELPFLSAPMDGFTSHLLTQAQGAHIKPGKRMPGQALAVLPSAIGDDRVFDKNVVSQMGNETGNTPYANQVTFGDMPYSPFKPVTHGQFCFTKLNIIDKFGQAVSAINPANLTPKPLYPVISEYYHPQQLPLATGAIVPNPNVVVKGDPDGRCRFVQIPPNINQDARVNAVFLTRDEPTAAQPLPPWRPALEWESPIWGWMVVNYVEEGVQFFLPDGTFYREVRLGGVKGTTEPPKWKPFGQPANGQVTPLGTSQLDSLLKKFDKDPNYLRDFIAVINLGLDAVPAAPTDYANYLPAIIGKPLALVNTGWSLELATDPLTNQSFQSLDRPVEKAVLDYKFPLRLGDPDRVFDGLIGFYEGTKNTYNPKTQISQGPVLGAELSLDYLYTHFIPTKVSGTSIKAIDEDNSTHFISLQPYKLNNHIVLTDTPEDLHAQHNSQYQVVGAIIDPYTSLHGYTGVQPITSLKLPAWSVQLALKRMTAFFTLGPLLITTPNPQTRYDPTLTISQTALPVRVPSIKAGTNATAVPGTGIPIPAMQTADWQWLQPYFVDDGTGTGKKTTQWNGLGVEPLENSAKLQDGPYTAVEGYLQLKQPLDGEGMAPVNA
ncbi:hypothetical protein BKA61DRAFT_499911 [Leptodontidium sp. MPI-SDFR-AT-0119]|nr:hypothetical protein BKA61DRAFT_499911 [Leptodontidium sp. MPI-SDFR-AT-0119]